MSLVLLIIHPIFTTIKPHLFLHEHHQSIALLWAGRRQFVAVGPPRPTNTSLARCFTSLFCSHTLLRAFFLSFLAFFYCHPFSPFICHLEHSFLAPSRALFYCHPFFSFFVIPSEAEGSHARQRFLRFIHCVQVGRNDEERRPGYSGSSRSMTNQGTFSPIKNIGAARSLGQGADNLWPSGLPDPRLLGAESNRK